MKRTSSFEDSYRFDPNTVGSLPFSYISNLCFPMGALQKQSSSSFWFLPKGIASWISFCRLLLKTSHRTTQISGRYHHYRLILYRLRCR